MTRADLEKRADQHATEAEQLLAKRFGILDNVLKAEAHATLAVYYMTQARGLPQADRESRAQ
jgi:hypothetical protein